MSIIDEIYTKYPFYGHRKIREELKDSGIEIGRKKTLRLMKEMGLEAIYPKPNTSKPHPRHEKFPYLLTNLAITYPDQVWGTDITYIRLKEGFVYLVALIDWYSRYVLDWQLSKTMETEFCVTALQNALRKAVPHIHNSDQGVQFTDRKYIAVLENEKIHISMDGKGRCMDNIFTERLWRTVKYENVYLREYASFSEAYQGLSEYFPFYNEQRKHQSLEYRTPAQVYFEKRIA
jgi:putative transposase